MSRLILFRVWRCRLCVGFLDLEKEVEEGNDTITKYVRIFGVKSFLAASVALLVIFGIF